MKRYGVKVLVFGQPTSSYVPGNQEIELEERENGQLVLWEDVESLLKQCLEELERKDSEVGVYDKDTLDYMKRIWQRYNK